jgi:hypothetical protein
MKYQLLALLLTVNTLTAVADEVEVRPLSADAAEAEPMLPTREKAFVEAINKFDKKSIVAQLGEPAKADDVRLKGSDKIVASIWHYHNINTAEDGSYYQTTELDFVDDKVVQVVFINNDGSEKNDGQTYEITNQNPPAANPDHTLGDGVPMIDLDKQ